MTNLELILKYSWALRDIDSDECKLILESIIAEAIAGQEASWTI